MPLRRTDTGFEITGHHYYTAAPSVDCFRGRYARLGNFSPCLVFYEGKAYQSVEHAYQAAKTTDALYRDFIRDLGTANAAKAFGRKLPLRPDWDRIKVHVMYTLLREKFAQFPEGDILTATGQRPLVEGNYWHDNFWGNCTCAKRESCREPGLNWLGRLLMLVRTELRDGYVPVSEGIDGDS